LPETTDQRRHPGDAVRRDIDKITATRLSGAAQKYGLKVSKRGRECHLLPGKPYGHGTRPPLVGWKGRVFALEELDDFFADFEAEHAASYGFEVDS
jgi:hypothetical protein